MNESEIRGLHEAYLKIYEDTTYEDLLEFCLIEELFDTIEESEYFVGELIHNDLVEEFVVDILEYYGYDDNEIALCENKGKLAAAALRGVVNALSSAGRSKAGLSGATALGKSGNVLKGTAASTSIRSARSAAKASMPAPEKAGKYLDMLKSTRDKQGKLLTTKGTAQNFRGGRTPFIGTDPVPVRPGRRGSGTPPSSTSSRTSPGQMKIDFTPRPPSTPKTPKAPEKQSGLTQTVRATLSPSEKAGSMKYPGLSKYATTGKEPAIKKSSSGGRTAAAVGAIGATAGLAPGASKNNTTAKTKPSQTDVYNTMDPSGKIRSRKKVGPRLVGDTFEDAFREARRSGKTTFKYGKDGKEFTTKLASEQTDLFDIILEYLVAEGYADTNENALVIMTNMSEEWRESIVEADERPENRNSPGHQARFGPGGNIGDMNRQQKEAERQSKRRMKFSSVDGV